MIGRQLCIGNRYETLAPLKERDDGCTTMSNYQRRITYPFVDPFLKTEIMTVHRYETSYTDLTSHWLVKETDASQSINLAHKCFKLGRPNRHEYQSTVPR